MSIVKQHCDEIIHRMEENHIGCFEGMDKPLFLISNQYPGLWTEHVYDSVIYAKMFPGNTYLAENATRLFLDNQRENGQIPAYVLSELKENGERHVSYDQIQEVVSLGTLCFEVYEMSGNREYLEKCYNDIEKWIGWLKKYRMTTGRGLIEMFVGYDTGHDNSGRLNGMACPGNQFASGKEADALPPDDGITPIIAVDMNCNFYGNLKALEKMATALGKPDEAKKWASLAAEFKKRFFEICYDKEDAFFYDVDRSGNKRKFLSSTIIHLFLEKVLDKEEDAGMIKEIYERHLKNPDEFWTPYPFPSMAICDPSCEGHKDFNCWGYYSQALIALRCTRWMDFYGFEKDFDVVCRKFVEGWTNAYDKVKFAQELDPITGEPTNSSEWYSSCMLFYIYAAKRLGEIE